MPTGPKPTTVLSLLHSIVDDPGRTRRAIYLLLAGALASVLLVGPLVLLVCLFGTTGVAVFGGLGALVGSGTVIQRRRRGGL